MNAKRGRPVGPIKSVLKKRVPVEDKDYFDSLVDAAIDKSLARWSEKNRLWLESKGYTFCDVKPDSETREAVKATWVQTPALDENLKALENHAKTQIGPLMDDIERLTKECAAWAAKLDRCSRATDDEKGQRWIAKYDQLVAKVAAKYPDETW